MATTTKNEYDIKNLPMPKGIVVSSKSQRPTAYFQWNVLGKSSDSPMIKLPRFRMPFNSNSYDGSGTTLNIPISIPEDSVEHKVFQKLDARIMDLALKNFDKVFGKYSSKQSKDDIINQSYKRILKEGDGKYDATIRVKLYANNPKYGAYKKIDNDKTLPISGDTIGENLKAGNYIKLFIEIGNMWIMKSQRGKKFTFGVTLRCLAMVIYPHSKIPPIVKLDSFDPSKLSMTKDTVNKYGSKTSMMTYKKNRIAFKLSGIVLGSRDNQGIEFYGDSHVTSSASIRVQFIQDENKELVFMMDSIISHLQKIANERKSSWFQSWKMMDLHDINDNVIPNIRRKFDNDPDHDKTTPPFIRLKLKVNDKGDYRCDFTDESDSDIHKNEVDVMLRPMCEVNCTIVFRNSYCMSTGCYGLSLDLVSCKFDNSNIDDHIGFLSESDDGEDLLCDTKKDVIDDNDIPIDDNDIPIDDNDIPIDNIPIENLNSTNATDIS